MALSKFLREVQFKPGEQTFCTIDPSTVFGFQAVADGKSAERVRGVPHVLVPVYDWQATHVDEDEAIAMVLVTAAENSPLKLPDVSHCTKLWTSQRGMKAVLINPNHVGKIRFPIGLPLAKSEIVPMNRLIILGEPRDVGYFIKQGYRRNVLAHNKRGITAVQFYTTP